MTKDRTWIYLLKDRQTGFYKIGQSIDPLGRMKTLVKQDTLQPTSNNYELIEAWWGVPQEERLLHQMFSARRQRGEWFELSDEELLQLTAYFMNRQRFSAVDFREDLDAAILDMWNELRRITKLRESETDELRSQLRSTTNAWKESREAVERLSNKPVASERLAKLPSLTERGKGT